MRTSDGMGAVPALRGIRSLTWLWVALPLLALALAASGLYASVWLELDRLRPYPPRAADGTIPDAARMRASYVAFCWLFTTPVVAVGSAFAALLAPAGRSRRGLVAAALLAFAVLVFSLVRTYARHSD